MPLKRLVIFVPDGVVSQYDALADSVAGSRSELMRWALEHSLPQVRDHVLSVAAEAVAPRPSSAAATPGGVSRPPAARPSAEHGERTPPRGTCRLRLAPSSRKRREWTRTRCAACSWRATPRR